MRRVGLRRGAEEKARDKRFHTSFLLRHRYAPLGRGQANPTSKQTLVVGKWPLDTSEGF